MDNFEIPESYKCETAESYRRERTRIENELTDWSRFSWGIFLGGLVVGSILEPPSFNEFGHETSPGAAGTIGPLLGLALLGAYYWRKRVLEGQLKKVWTFMPKHERDRSLGINRNDNA